MKYLKNISRLLNTLAKISKELKCTSETARYWIGQARAGQAHNWQDCPRGRPK
ncbi:MAG: hypothetical protein RLZZ381_1493, partial [Cyanobacteriota bacterium]